MIVWLLGWLGSSVLRWVLAATLVATIPLGIWAAWEFGVKRPYIKQGYDQCTREWTIKIERERTEQETAIREAGVELRKEIERLRKELEEKDVEIAILDAEGDADPDRDKCGLSHGSVQRINRSRAP